MSNIVVTLQNDEKIYDGKQVVFRAPCDCATPEAVVINGATFTLVDAIGRSILGTDSGYFSSGALVVAILDCTNSKAYIQNAAAVGFAEKAGTLSTTLPASKGGTGKTSLKASANALINALATGSNTPKDEDYFISQFAGGSTSTDASANDYYRKPVSALWSYIKGKADSVYLKLSGGTLTGTLTSNSVIPSADKSYTLGTADKAYNGAYSRHYRIQTDNTSYGNLTAFTKGTADTVGETRLALGNSTPEGTAGNAYGRIQLYNKGTYYTLLKANENLTGTPTINLPVTSGTLALTSQVDAKASLGAQAYFGGVHLGSSTDAVPYVYSENGNVNFQYLTSDGNKAWASVRGILDSIASKLPLSGGKLTGALEVGNCVKLSSTGEGGNVRLTSKDALNHWEMDALNNTQFRLYHGTNKSDGSVATEMDASFTFDASAGTISTPKGTLALTSDKFGSYGKEGVSSGSWMKRTNADGYTKELMLRASQASYAFTEPYGNMYYAPFSIVVPNYMTTFDAINITPHMVNGSGLCFAVVTSFTATKINGYLASPAKETKTVALMVHITGY